jgi:hypothetical protein
VYLKEKRNLNAENFISSSSRICSSRRRVYSPGNNVRMIDSRAKFRVEEDVSIKQEARHNGQLGVNARDLRRQTLQKV